MKNFWILLLFVIVLFSCENKHHEHVLINDESFLENDTVLCRNFGDFVQYISESPMQNAITVNKVNEIVSQNKQKKKIDNFETTSLND